MFVERPAVGEEFQAARETLQPLFNEPIRDELDSDLAIELLDAMDYYISWLGK